IRSSRNPDKVIDATITIKTKPLRKSLLKTLKSTPFGLAPVVFRLLHYDCQRGRRVVQNPRNTSTSGMADECAPNSRRLAARVGNYCQRTSIARNHAANWPSIDADFHRQTAGFCVLLLWQVQRQTTLDLPKV
ncbi:MAG: hypothetical protein ABGZ53_19020, partial [Fuerstiella sp.]